MMMMMMRRAMSEGDVAVQSLEPARQAIGRCQVVAGRSATAGARPTPRLRQAASFRQQRPG